MWDFIVLFEVLHAFLNSWQAFCINLLLRCMEKWYTSILISATFKVLALDIHFFFLKCNGTMGSFTFLYTCGHFLNGLLPQLTTVKKGNLYLMIYLSSAYFTLKWDSIIPARNRWPWRISQVLCIFQYKSLGFFYGYEIEWFKIKAFVIKCYLCTSNASFRIIKTLWE